MRAGLGGPSPQREACALALVDGDSAAAEIDVGGLLCVAPMAG